MDNIDSIKAGFKKAGIPLNVRTSSVVRTLGRGANSIVQMAINRTKKGESIDMFIPDDPNIDVKVLGTDSDLNQAVVMVKETERTFTETVWDSSIMKSKQITRKTGGNARRFLVGMDESHLFIAQLTSNATTVKDAHNGLRPKAIPAGKSAKKQKVRRSGEWFFTPATTVQSERVEAEVARVGSKKNVGVGATYGPMRGRPHVVSESIIIDRTPTTPNGIEFVRGRIIHPDHKVVHLNGWHLVRMNTENRSINALWAD